ncbi:MAG: HAMP domain-containing protein [Herminiimonas sp.]|nr:HAMP domain-containing protein [Herminiimonas sp.]
MHEAEEVAGRMAPGDLTTSFDIKRHDETGQLLIALKAMRQSG